MERSKREIPHYYLEEAIDLQRALVWLEAENRARPVPERILPAVLLLKATALALRESRELCGTWVEGGFRPASGIHVGVAISLRGGGTLAPAIRDVDRLALPELMAKLRDLVARTRRGVLRGSEVSDASITVTSLGEQGVAKVFGVIQPPQVALVGFGRIAERPWAEAGTLVVRPTIAATLSADHRASDGARGARFLAAIAKRLAEPEKL
jgi:pyruvate dehydrogenase E2 component (dihydrolipoamide acetyltransferase)